MVIITADHSICRVPTIISQHLEVDELSLTKTSFGLFFLILACLLLDFCSSVLKFIQERTLQSFVMLVCRFISVMAFCTLAQYLLIRGELAINAIKLMCIEAGATYNQCEIK